jgi:hypothetical protein
MTIFLLILAGTCLIGGIIFLYFVNKPHSEHQPDLSKRITAFTNPDTNASVLHNKIQQGKTQAYTDNARTQLEAAQVTAALHTEHQKAVTTDKTAPLKVENEVTTLEIQRLELDNRRSILDHANMFGVSPEIYGAVMQKAYEGKVELELKKMSTENTLEVGMQYADRHFKRARQLREQLLDLRLELETVKTKELPESVREIQIQDLQSNITTVQQQLEDCIGKAVIPEIDGQKSG